MDWYLLTLSQLEYKRWSIRTNIFRSSGCPLLNKLKQAEMKNISYATHNVPVQYNLTVTTVFICTDSLLSRSIRQNHMLTVAAD